MPPAASRGCREGAHCRNAHALEGGAQGPEHTCAGGHGSEHACARLTEPMWKRAWIPGCACACGKEHACMGLWPPPTTLQDPKRMLRNWVGAGYRIQTTRARERGWHMARKAHAPVQAGGRSFQSTRGWSLLRAEMPGTQCQVWGCSEAPPGSASPSSLLVAAGPWLGPAVPWGALGGLSLFPGPLSRLCALRSPSEPLGERPGSGSRMGPGQAC